MLTLLLISMLTLAFNIQPVRASGTIYIRPDGSVEGTDKIQRDGDVYTFTDNIYDGIVVEIDNIVVEGAGCTLQGTGIGKGIDLSYRSNVTIKDTEIKTFEYGIYLDSSSNNSIFGNNIRANTQGGMRFGSSSNCNTVYGNNITNNCYGIFLLFDSSGNTINKNNITANTGDSIYLYESSNNTINKNDITANNGGGMRFGSSSNCNTVYGNNITNNEHGILLEWSSNNTIFGNSITNNRLGIRLYESSNNTINGNSITNNNDGIRLRWYSNCNTIFGNSITNNNDDGIEFWWYCNYNYISGNDILNNYHGIDLSLSNDNKIYHNNFIDNTIQVPVYKSYGNVWDDGYPSGGNYWSDHVTVDDYSGINQDEPGSDGIVDEPYIIDYYNRDNYPLVKPWSPVISAAIDIDPDTLNLKSKGKWITAYIELPEGYDVSDIDVSTVMLNDTIPVSLLDVPAAEPVPTEIGDYDEDGIPDLMVKFDRAMVDSFICNQGITYDEVSLTITGELFDGTPFEGADIVFVNYAGDVNNDGMIDIFDIGVVSAHWYPGPPTGPLSYVSSADFNSDNAVDIFDIGILSVNWGQTTPSP